MIPDIIQNLESWLELCQSRIQNQETVFNLFFDHFALSLTLRIIKLLECLSLAAPFLPSLLSGTYVSYNQNEVLLMSTQKCKKYDSWGQSYKTFYSCKMPIFIASRTKIYNWGLITFCTLLEPGTLFATLLFLCKRQGWSLPEWSPLV